MTINKYFVFVVVSLTVLFTGFAQSNLSVVASKPAVSLQLNNPFFPFCVKASTNLLQELGYSPLHAVWRNINVDKTPAYDESIPRLIRSLKGTDTIIWFMVSGKRNSDKDEIAVKAFRELATIAEENSVRFSVYPHTGDYIITAREALCLVKKIDRKNVGLTLNLCHELRNDAMNDLPDTIKEVVPYLFCVTINGADRKEREQKGSWGTLIQPLGQGTFDVYQFLKSLKVAEYGGPIGLQCFGLTNSPAVHLKQSIETWKQYSQRMSEEQNNSTKGEK